MIMNSRQVVLITGSSTGFGRLFADTLARRGHTVFATMRDPAGENAKNAAGICGVAEKESLPVHVLGMDLTDDASVERGVAGGGGEGGGGVVVVVNYGDCLHRLDEGG